MFVELERRALPAKVGRHSNRYVFVVKVNGEDVAFFQRKRFRNGQFIAVPNPDDIRSPDAPSIQPPPT
jgi:NAD(P)H-flavin reductase